MIQKTLTKFRPLELISFVSGFVLMSYELIAARILAPTIGSSVYVWTSVIGTIIAALSVGYFIGGRLADSRAKLSDIAWLCIATAIAIMSTLIFYDQTLSFISQSITDPRLQGIAASLLLFVPASTLLGILSPYLVKLRVTSLATSGKSVASLSALNSIGGIAGTFVTGFILFGYIGLRESLVLCVVLILIISWLIQPRVHLHGRLVASIAILTISIGIVGAKDIYTIDTPSANYRVIKQLEQSTNRPITLLTTGPMAAQSGVYDDAPSELLFWYTHEMARIVDLHPTKKKILMLGGGTFTLSSHLSEKYPNSQIDVVEIDPKLEQIAKDHFGYHDRPNVRIIAEDARTYINRTDKTYDIVLVDAYSGIIMPPSLVTKEYIQLLGRAVNPDGAVIVNSIASLNGPCQEVLKVLHASYGLEFNHATYSKDPHAPKNTRSNMILTYSRSPLDSKYGQSLKLPYQAALTDNFAPTERLQQQCS